MQKILLLRITPRSSQNRVGETLADGSLKIFLTAAPTDGKANEALIKFLSAAWKIPKQNFKILKGQKSRLKTISIDLPRPNSTDYNEALSK